MTSQISMATITTPAQMPELPVMFRPNRTQQKNPNHHFLGTQHCACTRRVWLLGCSVCFLINGNLILFANKCTLHRTLAKKLSCSQPFLVLQRISLFKQQKKSVANIAWLICSRHTQKLWLWKTSTGSFLLSAPQKSCFFFFFFFSWGDL